MAFFKKVACFTDIHFGLKGNSRVHNDDCEDFVKWFIEQAKAQGCETCIFLGDWHHHRSATNVSTMNYTVSNMERLGAAFEKVYVIMGNHDLYYRDKREINSMEYIRNIPNIHIVNEWLVEEDVAIIPWVVGDEWKKIEKMKQKYVFGHFELPYFKMNAMVEMPDVGGIQTDHFVGCEKVFSGHFHKRQIMKNVTYMGNAFPHNYADAWDDDRGMMILDRENNKEPEYLSWSDCPKYRTTTLSQLLDPNQDIIKSNMYLRVTIDVPISYEEAQFIKETYITQYKCREITLIPQKQVEEISTDLDISTFESVDEIVSKEITAIDSDNFNKKMLLDIYNEL